MKPLSLLSLAVIFTMCNTAKQETPVTDSTAVQQKDTVIAERSEPVEEPNSSPSLDSKSFEEIPLDLQEFITAVQDPSKLALYINSTVGCYILEEGPGIYPIVTEVNTVGDLNKSNQFTLFMNTPQLYNGYYINSEDVDPCNLTAEGIYFFDAKRDGHLLLNAYQSHLTAASQDMSDEIKTKLDELDAALLWYGAINLPNERDELNTFDIYLAMIDNRICLAAIDTRGCGI